MDRVMDMDEHKTTQGRTEAGASEDSFSIQELVDASPAPISLIDTQKWQVRFQNDSSRAMFGSIVGKSCHENIA
ncbi:MAG TPA: PAS domain-containing protein, partial [Nitrospiraceae bacterium]|nr:PAS domain-containing protein [Nitrospiraceae bacterium]